MLEFFHSQEELFFWLTLVGLIGFIGSIIVIPWVLIKLPSDYFYAEKRKKCPWGTCPEFIRYIIIAVKNILGIILIFSGIIMLFIPGQGVLTILVGIILTDFPNKYKFLRRIIKKPKILSSINRLRKKANQPPLEI